MGTSVLWVALAEKAYAEANGLGIVTSGDKKVDSYDALNGGYPAWALQAITGETANQVSVTAGNLTSAWDAGDFVTICSDTTPSSTTVVGSHCYAVVGFNGSEFEILNPWGVTSSGWELGTENGHQVYSLFWATPTFLSENYDTVGVGLNVAAAGTLSPTNAGDHIVDSWSQWTDGHKSDWSAQATPNLQLAMTANWNHVAGADSLKPEDGGFYSIQLN